MTRLDLSQLTVAPGPYRSDGRVVKALDGGRWHPIAYCDSNGYLSAYSERDTAHLLAASPALVAALRDAYAREDALTDALRELFCSFPADLSLMRAAGFDTCRFNLARVKALPLLNARAALAASDQTP